MLQTIRYALRGAGQAMAALAQPLLSALPEHFAASRQSCYLYAASELVKTFGGNPAYEQALGGYLGCCVISIDPPLQIRGSDF